MGKIVRNANLNGEKYVVAVPRVDASPVPQPVRELDERFAAPYGRAEAAPFPGDDLVVPASAPVQPQIDWDAVRADAEAIIDRATADAQELIVKAKMQALELVAQAETRATSIEEEARVSGQSQGFEAGKATADAEMTEMLETMRSLIESARSERRFIIEGAEPELLRLAMAIAERIVHQQVSVDPSVVVENVRNALTRLVTREVVTLRVHPADLDAIRQHRDALVSSSDIEHLRIVEDQRVDRGGVVVETDAGTIDAKVATQLREARRAITSDDSIALGATHDDTVLRSSAQAS